MSKVMDQYCRNQRVPPEHTRHQRLCKAVEDALGAIGLRVLQRHAGSERMKTAVLNTLWDSLGIHSPNVSAEYYFWLEDKILWDALASKGNLKGPYTEAKPRLFSDGSDTHPSRQFYDAWLSRRGDIKVTEQNLRALIGDQVGRLLAIMNGGTHPHEQPRREQLVAVAWDIADKLCEQYESFKMSSTQDSGYDDRSKLLDNFVKNKGENPLALEARQIIVKYCAIDLFGEKAKQLVSEGQQGQLTLIVRNGAGTWLRLLDPASRYAEVARVIGLFSEEVQAQMKTVLFNCLSVKDSTSISSAGCEK